MLPLVTEKPDRKQPSLKRLISFDIDGTMEFGDPAGQVPTEWVKRVKEAGYVIGSASDRTVANQRRLWQENGIELDFVTLKHHLDDLKKQFDVDEYWHVGDSYADRLYASRAEFTFFEAESFVEEMRRDGHYGFEAF